MRRLADRTASLIALRAPWHAAPVHPSGRRSSRRTRQPPLCEPDRPSGAPRLADRHCNPDVRGPVYPIRHSAKFVTDQGLRAGAVLRATPEPWSRKARQRLADAFLVRVASDAFMRLAQSGQGIR